MVLIFFFIFILLVLILLLFIIRTLQKNNDILQANNQLLEHAVQKLNDRVETVQTALDGIYQQNGDFGVVSVCLTLGTGVFLFAGILFLIMSTKGSGAETGKILETVLKDQDKLFIEYIQNSNKEVLTVIFENMQKSSENQQCIIEGVTKILSETRSELTSNAIDAVLNTPGSISAASEFFEAMNR